MKKIIFSAALLMGFAVVSFAGNPKVGTTSLETPAATKASTQASFYWYEVTYDALGAPFVSASATEEEGEREEVEGDCAQGNQKLCKVGYSLPQPLPIANPGAAPQQITRAD